MIPINRETIVIVATIICAAGILFLFRELNKTREEMNHFKDFSEQVTKHLSAPAPKKTVSFVPEPEKEPDVIVAAPTPEKDITA
jgi:hypothetical protein